MCSAEEDFTSSWSRWRYLDRDSVRLDCDFFGCRIIARRLSRSERHFWWALYAFALIFVGILACLTSVPNEARALLIVLFIGFAVSAPKFQSIGYIATEKSFVFQNRDILFRRKRVFRAESIDRISLSFSSYDANSMLEVYCDTGASDNHMFAINVREPELDSLIEFVVSFFVNSGLSRNIIRINCGGLCNIKVQKYQSPSESTAEDGP